ncbi:hypothetical protein GCM10025867_11070 [Frondihabitans sucicola]|uniref:HTH araC/xylS-type domain-containing protein n=1 Tax=Frondihabitans sucicola TaxID=1268041 RepID=A0ABM8GKD6_9MICO|nr:helix-turn-helix transcriptional regulator [Frondihabitans sucicola]BDZ48866.1 hypothetical protein GCM10025867_11070 [Frondihabitans sucicola]
MPPVQSEPSASDSVARSGGPAVVHAATYHMKRGEVLHNTYVESVCFVWTVSGSGTIECNGETFGDSGDFMLRLPWGHEVRATCNAPFQFGVVHVVPWLEQADDFVARVAVRSGDPLLGAPGRSGRGSGPAIAAIPAHSPSGARLTDLATYTVSRFLEERVEESALRSLGVLLMDESRDWDHSASGRQYPASLNRMMRFVDENLRSPLTARVIADSAAVSTSTAERLFLRHTGTSVRAWLRRRRMKVASVLLQNSDMHVREVAISVGIPDAFYFSRVFTAAFGVPPSQYADSVVRSRSSR